MKLILREDVKNLGRAGEAIKVAEGYGRNYLLPKQLAILATPANLKRLEQELQGKKGRERRIRQDAVYQAESIAAQPLIIHMAAGEGGKLFGSVTAADIEKLLAEKGIELDKRKIELEEPIKSLGTYTVSVKLHTDVAVSLTIHVEAQAPKVPTPQSASPSAESVPALETKPESV